MAIGSKWNPTCNDFIPVWICKIMRARTMKIVDLGYFMLAGCEYENLR